MAEKKRRYDPKNPYGLQRVARPEAEVPQQVKSTPWVQPAPFAEGDMLKKSPALKPLFYTIPDIVRAEAVNRSDRAASGWMVVVEDVTGKRHELDSGYFKKN